MCRHRDFAAVARLGQCPPEDMRSALAQGQAPGLGKRGWTAGTAGTSKDAGVGWAVRDIDHEAVQSHEPQPLIKGSWRVGRSLQFDHMMRQPMQRCHAEPLTSFAERRASRRAFATKRLQPLEHLAIAIATE